MMMNFVPKRANHQYITFPNKGTSLFRVPTSHVLNIPIFAIIQYIFFNKLYPFGYLTLNDIFF